MIVDVRLKDSSQKIRHMDVANAYQKGSFYCIFDKGENIVYKYPIQDIWRIEEEHNPTVKSRLSTDPVTQKEIERTERESQEAEDE